MLKKNGKSKPSKKVKCTACGRRVDISIDEIEEVAGSKVAFCPCCQNDIILKK